MAIVSLEIRQPRHGQRFVDPQPIQLSGRVVADPGAGEGPLHLRWYSSLQAGATDEPNPVVDGAGDAPLNGSDDDPLRFARLLQLGTHVLTLSAKDVPGDGEEDLRSVTRSGVAGGRGPPGNPCVVTILHADILEPEGDEHQPRPVLSGEVTLTARAPARWGKDISGEDEPPRYGPDTDYHEHNAVGYRWELVADGGREPAVRWEAEADELEFDPGNAADGRPPGVRLRRELPGGLAGPHTLVLQVFDIGDPDGPSSTRSAEVEVVG